MAWGIDIESGEPFFEETTLHYSCTLPTTSNGKGAALPGMEMSGGAGPASPIPASSHAQNYLCDFPSSPVSELEGRVASLESHEVERGCSHEAGKPGLGYSLRHNK